jgi:hypothetical protein
MIFPIVVSPDPQGPCFEQIWIYNISEKLSCKHELFWLSGSWKENFQMTLHHFCDYLHFEEDLALYLNNLENSLYPIIICTKFYWNWHARSGEDFFPPINICKYGFLYCGPSRPSESFHVNVSHFGSMVLEKILKLPIIIFLFLFFIISPLKRTWPCI